MEFKKKTIIWEDNNEPPKDYIWAKKDGKFYEYNYATRSWVESESISGGSEGSGSGEGFDLNATINECLVQEAPPSAQSRIVPPDIWCYNENNSFKELSIEIVIEFIVEGNRLSILPFYKESPQTDSTNYYIKAENPGVSPIAGRNIERIESEVINGETYYYIGNGVM